MDPLSPCLKRAMAMLYSSFLRSILSTGTSHVRSLGQGPPQAHAPRALLQLQLLAGSLAARMRRMPPTRKVPCSLASTMPRLLLVLLLRLVAGLTRGLMVGVGVPSSRAISAWHGQQGEWKHGQGVDIRANVSTRHHATLQWGVLLQI
jgi:hypothetical protein